jgi:hypothetical protein
VGQTIHTICEKNRNRITALEKNGVRAARKHEVVVMKEVVVLVLLSVNGVHSFPKKYQSRVGWLACRRQHASFFAVDKE